MLIYYLSFPRLGCPEHPTIQDVFYLSPGRRTVRGTHTNDYLGPSLVRMLSFHVGLLCFCPCMGGGTTAPVSICGTDSRSIIPSQSNYAPQHPLPYRHFRLIIDTSHIYRINPFASMRHRLKRSRRITRHVVRRERWRQTLT